MLKIRIETKNDAFVGNKYCETIRCLKDVIEKLESNWDKGKIYDINGNVVGEFILTNR